MADTPLREQIGRWLRANYGEHQAHIAVVMADRLLSDIPLLGAAEGMREALQEAWLSRAPDYAEVAHPGWYKRVDQLLQNTQKPPEEGDGNGDAIYWL